MPVRPQYMNVERFHALLEASRFDAVVATSFRNVYYLSGALIETQRRIPLRLAIVVWPRSGTPTLIVGDIEEPLAKHESHLVDVRAYVEFRETPIQALLAVLQEKGLENSYLGIESEHLMMSYADELRGSAPEAKLLQADRFFDDVRRIKTPAEVDLLARAARSTERAIREAFAAARPGQTEQDVGLHLVDRLLRSGADSMRFLVLGAGENSVFAHHIPTGRKLAVGDTIRLDVGAYFHGYASDIARMAFVGSPSPSQASLYQRMVEIHQETIAAVRPGQRACDVYTTCQRAFLARGLELTTPHVGHGFGVDGGHEEPLLHPANEAPLEPGMVLAVEPILHHPVLGGYHLEDLLLVTADGAQLLSDQTETTAAAIIPA